MAIVYFKYYMHDNSFHERVDEIESQTGVELTDEMMQKIGRPFYEVELECTLDTDTGHVEIVSAK